MDRVLPPIKIILLFLYSVKKELEEIEAERLRQREISAASKEAKDAAKEQRKLGQLYEDMDDDDDFWKKINV